MDVMADRVENILSVGIGSKIWSEDCIRRIDEIDRATIAEILITSDQINNRLMDDYPSNEAAAARIIENGVLYTIKEKIFS